MASVTVTYAAPHHLVADGPAIGIRRTAAGDAWARRQAGEDTCGVVTTTRAPVGLGVPTIASPADTTVAVGS